MTYLLRALAVTAVAGLMAIGGARADSVDSAGASKSPMQIAAVRNANMAEVRALVAGGVKVVDIRRPDEWRESGVIPGSILITAIDAEGRLVPGFPAAMAAAVGADEPVVVICRSGNRSATVSRLLSERGGYTRIVNADGGIRAWVGGGNPVMPCPSC